MTTSEMDTLLGQLLSDTVPEVWTQADHRLPTLNFAQDDLVLLLVGMASSNPRFKKLINLVAELQETESISIDTSGFDFANTTDRDYITSGYVASKVTINNKVRYPTKIDQDQIGFESNRFIKGNDRSPKVVIWKNKLTLLVDVGTLPVVTEIYYVGKPYKIAIAASGSGKTKLVATSDLNPMMHDLIVKIASIKCFAMRSDDRDLQRIQQITSEINNDLQLLMSGAIGEPVAETPDVGQFLRTSEVQNAKTSRRR